MSRYALPPSFPAPPPHEPDDVRGMKRKIAGWTAPGDIIHVQTHAPPIPSVLATTLPVPPLSVPSSPTARSAPREDSPQVKHEPPDIKPEPVHTASPAPSSPLPPTYARMGTRIPASGDLGNTGARTVTRPRLAGVSIGGGGGGGGGSEMCVDGQETITEEECYTWTDLPMNKQGFRYIPCGPSPVPSPSVAHPFYRRVPALHAPFGALEPPPPPPATATKTELTDFPDCPTTSPSSVHLDPLDRSPYLKLSPSFHTCTAEKGFRSVRANVPVRTGAWYYEALIIRGGGDSASSDVSRGRRFGCGGDGGASRDVGGAGAHVRLGFARREAPLNGPAGLDGYSYALRDATGQCVHLSRPRTYSSLGGFGTGDVIGCLIDLPPVLKPATPIKRKRIPIRYKGQLYFESMEYTVPKEMDALVARDGRPVPEPVASEEEQQDNPRPPCPSPLKKGKAAAAAAAGKKRKKPGKRDPAGDDEQAKQPRPRALPRLRGSRIRFFLNGQPMAEAPAFEDLFDFAPLGPTEAERASKAALIKKLGALEASLRDRENECDDGTLGYYPFISCFGGGKVQFNPGPTWMAPVAPDAWGLGTTKDHVPRTPRPFSDRWTEFAAEETTYDRADEEELTALLRTEEAAAAAETKAAASPRGGKRAKPGTTKAKVSVSKRASIAAAIQAASSIPISRASSETTGAAVEKSEAYLATVVQDRGTPAGTPVPGTPVQDGFTPVDDPQPVLGSAPATMPSSATLSQHPDSHHPFPPSNGPASPQPIPSETPVSASPTQAPPPSHTPNTRNAGSSATSEDAPGEDDWSPAVSERMMVADDEAPELPYGMEVAESLIGGAGQIQQQGS